MEETSGAERRHLARTVAGAVLVGLISTIVPLTFATPAFAARQKTITIADATIIEGDSGQQSLSFKITWSGSNGPGAVSVSYATANITATAGSDYTAKTGTASLTPGGCRCATISVPVLGDAVSEGTETFAVNLTAPVNAVIRDGHAVGTIIDNEGPTSLVALDASAAENAGPLSFGVFLTKASASTQTVRYSTLAGTASAGSDYTSTSGTLTFTSGQTSKTVPVPIIDDTLDEADEGFTLVLSNATVTLADDSATGTITNDDPEPGLSVGDASAAENAGPRSFTITLSTASGREVNVDYTTTDGTATGGVDYTTTTGTAVIPAGQTNVQVNVPVTDDATYESDESLTLDLATPYNASILDPQGAGTVTNDDPLPAATIGNATVSEGVGGTTPATFTVTLDRASDSTATVGWSTADGTATVIGSDYVLGSGTVTFTPGVTSQQFSVDVVGDAVDEYDETFTVTLSTPSGATVATGTGTGTITDDDRTLTSLTLRERTTRAKVSAKGVLEAAATGSQVTVSLLKKKGTTWVVTATRVVTVGLVGDRDTDGIPDAAYHVGFKRPSKGTYRVRSVFAGTLALLPCSKTVTVKI